jgi:uncharacterized Ntn-hydrolase superfamily protein
VSTAIPAVGSRVPHAEAGIGAIATQAYTNVSYGVEGLKLLRNGFSPLEALETMLKKDSERELRQVIIIDCHGRTAAFTGRETVEWRGHLIGRDYVAAGNMLVGGEVIEAMARAFECSSGCDLAERLMKALEAGQEAGGDVRGKVSAALLVVGNRPILDLRVNWHREPVRELRRMLEECKETQKP